MPEFPLTDSIITSLNAQEPWPDNVKLFQPYEVEQILLPDNASCLAVQAFLKMCNLPFEVEMRWNAEFMSPSGRVPFIKCGAFVVSELEPIVQFAANKGVSLCGKLSLDEKAEMRAYMSLITNVLVNAELYISWIDDETYNAVTKVRNSSVYPWPLGWLQTRSKRNAVAKRLRALHWGEKTLDRVLADVEQCCNSLSQRLGERDYFFGTTPTPLDALVYGHMRALLSANGPKTALFIKPMTTSLLKHVVRMIGITGMNLTPQEEYLLTQAFHFTRRRLSPERSASEGSTRIRRSKLCIRNTSIENVNFSYSRDVFGFKPFACKQIILTTTKDGAVTCNYNKQFTTTLEMEENNNFAKEIIEDLLDKIEEMAFVDLNVKYDEKNDFEMVYTNDEQFGNNTFKVDEFLDTIEENDVTDTTVSLDMAEDLIQIINDDDTDENYVINNEMMDSDGIVNDKLLEEAVLIESSNVNSDVTDSSKAMKEVFRTFSGSRISKQSDTLKSDALKFDERKSDGLQCDELASNVVLTPVTGSSSNISKKSEQSDTLLSEPRTPVSSGSKSTLKFPCDEEISVESLLQYLRERNPTYGHFGNYVDVADVD